jgi:hypothetical protein
MQISTPSVLLMGTPGSGKTFSIATLARRVEKLFYLFTDPGGDESLVDALQFYNVPIDNIHWHYVSPAVAGWKTMEELTQKGTRMNYESLAGLKQGIDKGGHRQMYELLGSLQDFHCMRTGEKFGSADEWPDTYGVVFDSLTGLNKIARDTTVGAKPTMHQGEWGIAMSMQENFIRKFVAGIKGPRVMIGHMDMNRDEVLGRVTLQVSLLGNKLAPQIPHLFSDCLMAYSEAGQFFWSNEDARATLKSRNLPLGAKHKPDFGPLLDKYEKRKEYAKGTTVKEEAVPEEKA